jgi:acid phosphatase
LQRTLVTMVVVGGLALGYAALHALQPEPLPRVLGAPAAPASVPYEPADGPALHVLVVGDTGTGDERERATGAAMAADAERVPADFVVLLGDNFYPSGVASGDDAQWRTAFSEPFQHAALDVPFYALLGNHDYGGEPGAQVGWSGDPRWRMPARYYAFEEESGGTSALFVMLDTMGLLVAGPDARAQQLAWLRETLAASRADWKLVAGHHPLRSGGVHGVNAALTSELEPALVAGGVTLYMAGHDHHLAWMELDSGLAQLVSGAGSKPEDVRWTGETVSAVAGLGFACLRIERERLWVQLVSTAGGRVRSTHVLEAGARVGGAGEDGR